MTNGSILWRRLDRPGHEAARLYFQNSSWHLTGTAVFGHDRRPCQLGYSVVCDSAWQTHRGRVTGWIGDEIIDVDLSVDANRNWTLNGAVCREVAGYIDLDLNFSPSTNVLPIRRLNLPVGQRAEVKAAWLRFPSFRLEPLDQVYHRIDRATYRYESAGGKFVAELKVNELGLVTHYPNVWQVEADEGT